MSFGSKVILLEPRKLKLWYSTKRNIHKISTNLHCGEAASHKTQKNRMLKTEVSCYSRTIYLLLGYQEASG